MPIYKVWITTHMERSLYVDAEDERTAEAATWEYLNDSVAFGPALPTPWEYADSEDYIDADRSRTQDAMAAGDIRAVVRDGGDIGYIDESEPR